MVYIVWSKGPTGVKTCQPDVTTVVFTRKIMEDMEWEVPQAWEEVQAWEEAQAWEEDQAWEEAQVWEDKAQAWEVDPELVD